MSYWIKIIRDRLKRDNPRDRSNPVVGSCAQCGRELHRADWFSCRKQDCPTQPKVSF